MRLTLGELSSGSLRFGVNVGTLLQELTQALPTLSLSIHFSFCAAHGRSLRSFQTSVAFPSGSMVAVI
jgi:hypothetical protein